ncbi:MAG: extracellular solute-binding protein [Gorillibacterium sp.]|nr:extracellular solute-binding protein [Gorillibacterium sp.]
MYKGIRKPASILLAATLLLTACSNSSKSAPSSTEASTASATQASVTASPVLDPMAKYEPAIEVKLARPSNQAWKYPTGDSLDNNIWSREYLDKLGIKVTTDWTAEAGPTGYDQKMNVAIASGSLPDMFSVTATQLKQLADAGQLADLTEIFDQYATPLTKQMMNSDGGLGLNTAKFDGKLLALPGIGATFYGPKLLWIRTDWLKKLNLPEPKTMQDVFAISDAFTNKDPDGNSKSDSFGLGLSKDLYNGGVALLDGFANGFHAYPWIWVKNDDGSVSYGSTSPQMKAALGKLQELYKSGQIDKEFGVKDSGKIGESAAANKLGMFFGESWMPYYPLLDAMKQNPGMEWKPFLIPSIDDKPAKGGASFPTNSYVAIRKGFEHPEAIVKLMNIQQEKMLQTPIDPNSPFNIVMQGEDRIENYQFAVVGSGIGSQMVADSIRLLGEALEKDDPEIAKGMLAENDKFEPIRDFRKTGNMTNWPQAVQYDAFKLMLNYYDNDLIQTSVLAGQTETMGEKWAALEKLEKETFTKIIMGAAPIDDFDKFVTTWNDLGGKQITEEVTELVNK